MSSKMGRPTTDPKTHVEKIRVSDGDLEMLQYCVEKTGLNKSEIFRLGLHQLYEKLKSEK